MIATVSISNYRSIGEDVQITLGDMTVLVGENGSGKSSVVDAIRFVSDALAIGLSGAVTHRHGIQAVRRWSSGHPFDLTIGLQLRLSNGSGGYSFTLTGDRQDEYAVKRESAWVEINGQPVRFTVESGAWLAGPTELRPPLDKMNLALPLVGGDARFRPLVDALRNTEIYEIFPDTLREPQKYDPRKPMDRHGANWASILKDQSPDTWRDDLVVALQKLTGDINDVRIQSAAGLLVVEFLHAVQSKKKGVSKWFSVAQESDGTLRVAGIVSALLQDPPLMLVGIEEPELTVHPGAIPLLYDYLKQASRRSQILITTHSPDLLDLFAESDVRVVTRQSGVTKVSTMLKSQRAAVQDRLVSLGDVMRSEGVQPELPFDQDA